MRPNRQTRTPDVLVPVARIFAVQWPRRCSLAIPAGRLGRRNCRPGKHRTSCLLAPVQTVEERRPRRCTENPGYLRSCRLDSWQDWWNWRCEGCRLECLRIRQWSRTIAFVSGARGTTSDTRNEVYRPTRCARERTRRCHERRRLDIDVIWIAVCLYPQFTLQIGPPRAQNWTLPAAAEVVHQLEAAGIAL